LHPSRPHRTAARPLAALAGSLAALAGSLAVLLALPALGHAEESNPNDYSCLGHVAPGAPEAGSEEQQVRYVFYCDGPITGYQVESQIPMTGVQGSPLVVNREKNALTDTFSCSGAFPGDALNCVGAAKAGYETITGQFSIGKKLCAEPRVDPLLTVTYAYLEKGVVTQAISGPFDLGRPVGCRADASSGSTRLNPISAGKGHKKTHKGTRGGAKKKGARKK
jgi:hypothetical protein